MTPSNAGLAFGTEQKVAGSNPTGDTYFFHFEFRFLSIPYRLVKPT